MVIDFVMDRLLKDAQKRKQQQLEEEGTTEEYNRLKVNPLGEILKENIDWIISSKLFSNEQKKAAFMIANCKTEKLGGYLDYCPTCNKVVEFRYCSCNNRNCPNCQYPMQQKWVEMRKNELIPDIPYYHIILTCPHELNPLFQENQSEMLSLLMRSASQAVIKMCDNPKVLGAKPSILSVLHTWSSNLQLHFHSHMLVSGGGLDADGNFVRLTDLRKMQKNAREAENCQKDKTQCDSNQVSNDDESGNDYFIHMQALTALFRGMFMAELRKLYKKRKLTIPASLEELTDPIMWSRFCFKLEQMDWVGDLEKAPGGGENVIEYFARYAYRTAISNSRIKGYDGKCVYFTVKVKSKDNPKRRETKIISLDVHTFISRFLSHILPKRFSRVRTFGILSNAKKNTNLQTIHDKTDGKTYTPCTIKDLKGVELMQALMPDKTFGVCPFCNGKLESKPFGLLKKRIEDRERRKRGAE